LLWSEEGTPSSLRAMPVNSVVRVAVKPNQWQVRSESSLSFCARQLINYGRTTNGQDGDAYLEVKADGLNEVVHLAVACTTQLRRGRLAAIHLLPQVLDLSALRRNVLESNLRGLVHSDSHPPPPELILSVRPVRARGRRGDVLAQLLLELLDLLL
jgi:hypothetical protein